MNRKVCLVSPTIGQLLVKQIAHELKNYNLYRSFAIYFDTKGVVKLSEYFNKRADEENNHHKWIADFLSEGDYEVIYPMIEKNEVTINDFTDPFIATVDREIETTQLIYRIYETAIAEKDYMTASWLFKKLIKEQIEEENISRMALSIVKLEGDLFVKAEEILELLEK